MATYGNIVTVFNCNDTTYQNIKQIFIDKSLLHEEKENTFYVETTSKQNTRDLVDAITQLNIEFIFFHNGNSDGSRIDTNGIDQDFAANVKKILFL